MYKTKYSQTILSTETPTTACSLATLGSTPFLLMLLTGKNTPYQSISGTLVAPLWHPCGTRVAPVWQRSCGRGHHSEPQSISLLLPPVWSYYVTDYVT